MAQSINLVPQEEVYEQTKSKVVKFSSLFSIVLLISVGAISYYILDQKTGLERQLNTLNKDIDTLRSDINELSSIEVTARTLDKRYKVLYELIHTRPEYSRLVTELATRTPETIVITSFSIKDNIISISGQGNDYLSIAGFTNNLLDETFDEGVEGLETLFESAVLNSVSLSTKDGKVDFVLNVTFNGGLLVDE